MRPMTVSSVPSMPSTGASPNSGFIRVLDLMNPTATACQLESKASRALKASCSRGTKSSPYSVSSSHTRKHSSGSASLAIRMSTRCQVSQRPTAPGVSTRPRTKFGGLSAWFRPFAVRSSSLTLVRSNSLPSTAGIRSAMRSRPALARHSSWACARSGRRSKFSHKTPASVDGAPAFAFLLRGRSSSSSSHSGLWAASWRALLARRCWSGPRDL
mmetsp:Transcript_91895/g.291540  ORF Transcript_91895/g.291540 Transcript_91895/m.291540 type:complete len:214 (+) Transcript_91895:880-1521(+)